MLELLNMLTAQVSAQWEWVLRIFISAVLGAAIGFERKNRNKMAGVRTHAIVALGAALMMVVSKYGFYDMGVFDASKVAAQIVSGVGFLGAGIIFVRNNSSVSGLTTAAGIWATAGIGMSVGSGLYFVALVSALLIIGAQILMHSINFLSQEAYQVNLKLVLKNENHGVKGLEAYILREKVEIKHMKISRANKLNTKMDLEVIFPPGYDKTQFINALAAEEGVVSVRG